MRQTKNSSKKTDTYSLHRCRQSQSIDFANEVCRRRGAMFSIQNGFAFIRNSQPNPNLSFAASNIPIIRKKIALNRVFEWPIVRFLFVRVRKKACLLLTMIRFECLPGN